MRPAPIYPAPNTAAACANNETAKSVRTEAFNLAVDTQMEIERIKISSKPADWVNNWVADPAAELAALYYQIALNLHNEADIGKIVKIMFYNKIRDSAKFIVSEIED